MAKITVQLADADAEKRIERYDDGNLQSGAFVKSTEDDGETGTSNYVIDTCAPTYEKFASETLSRWLSPFLSRAKAKGIFDTALPPANAGLVRLQEVLASEASCVDVYVKEAVIHPVFSSSLPDMSKGRSVAVNAIPMEWARRYFTQMIADKDPLFEYKIDLLEKIGSTSENELLTAKALEKLILDANAKSADKNPLQKIFGPKSDAAKSAGSDEAATFEKIIKHYQEEALYTRSLVFIDGSPYMVTVFADPFCHFIYVEFTRENEPRFGFSTLETEAKLPNTFAGNALGLADDKILAALHAIQENFAGLDPAVQPQAAGLVTVLKAQLPPRESR